MAERAERAVWTLLDNRAARLERAGQLLAAFSYRGVLSRGFALVRDGAGQPLRTAAAVQPGMTLDIEFSDGRVGATAQGVSKRIESPPFARPRPRKRRGGGGDPAREACSGSEHRAVTSRRKRRVARRASDELFGHPRGLTYPLHHRDVGALLLLRHEGAARALHGEVSASPRARADRDRLRRAQGRRWNSLFGPLDIQPLSSHIYGLYTGLVYLTPVLGGYLADRVLGQRRMVIIGASLMAIGHFMMAFEPLFLLALLVLILGNGAFKPNISTQVGTLYAPGDPRRDRAFSIFYVGINLGAFLAPLVCGTLGEELGWHYGFGAAGIGMTHRACDLSLRLAHAAARRAQPGAVASGRGGAPFGRDEWRAIGALILLALPVTFFWATYEQQGNTIALWADGYTDRTINSGLDGKFPSPGSRRSTRS